MYHANVINLIRGK